MIVRHPWVRPLLPWIVIALVLSVFIGWVWPQQIRQILSYYRDSQQRLASVPSEDSIPVQKDRWARDTVRLHNLLHIARQRSVYGAQASSALTAQLVEILENRDWEIDQASASAESTHIAVRVSAQLPFSTIVRGLDDLERSPLAIQIKSLQIRPNGPWNDIQMELQVPRGDQP